MVSCPGPAVLRRANTRVPQAAEHHWEGFPESLPSTLVVQSMLLAQQLRARHMGLCCRQPQKTLRGLVEVHRSLLVPVNQGECMQIDDAAAE